MEGFIILDHIGKAPEMTKRLFDWIQAGKIKYEVDVQHEPLEKIVDVFNRLFTGKNKGKQLLKVAHSI